MKNLKEYIIQEKNYIDKPVKSINDYIGNFIVRNSCITCNVCEQTYEDWLKQLNITENKIDDDLYKLYLNENFDNEMRSYNGYQNNIYETLNKSLSTEKLIQELIKQFNGDNFVIKNGQNKIQSFYFEVTDDKILNNINFISLLSYYNYYVANIYKIENKLEIHLDPYKPQEVSDYIYTECNGILYHVTFKDNYNKIKKYGLKPIDKGNDTNKSNYKETYRPYRLFFISSPNKENIRTQLRQLSNTILKSTNEYTSNNKIILKIDLSKYRYKLKFYEDTNALGYTAYFTEEPIPPYCIEQIKLENI